MGASAYCDSATQSWWRCISSACCRRPVADRQDPGPCCACACFDAGMADLHGRGGGALLANWAGPSRQSALIRICSTDLDLLNLFFIPIHLSKAYLCTYRIRYGIRYQPHVFMHHRFRKGTTSIIKIHCIIYFSIIPVRCYGSIIYIFIFII
jgi:hypothetical protein